MALAASVLVAALAGSAHAVPILRYEVHPAPDAHVRPRPLLFTVGGPVYCMQLQTLAHRIDASLACTDYGPNGDQGAGARASRREDWGDPAYDAAAAAVPHTLEAAGLRVSKLIVVGVSYAGYADAELVATHPEMHPAALVVVDSYLDLAARFAALPAYHETRLEMESVLGGTPATDPSAYDARSPSHHLDGLVQAIRGGMRLLVVWSLAASERHEFNGATCSRLADAQWLADLAHLLGRPLTAYTTELPHAHALWDRGQGLLDLAGIPVGGKRLRPHPVVYGVDGAVPPASYC